MNILRRKSVADLQAEAHTDNSLHRVLGPWNLVLLGVGCTIGGGVFVLTGIVAAHNAGPAVILGYVLAGIVSIFAAFCYSEFASLVPMSGSAYTYSYATLGEIFAWIIGWDLILEYAVGAVTVAISWSRYVVSFLHDVTIWLQHHGSSISLDLPLRLTAARGTEVTHYDGSVLLGPDGHAVTGLFNLPAIVIVFLVTILIVLGIKQSAVYNNLIVVVKIGVILLFIVLAAQAINPANWHPFIPPNTTGEWGAFGWSGVMEGAGTLFFAYIGFDAVSTTAQETRNPQRDLPIGIIGSLIVCTILYIAVAIVATGVVPYSELGGAAPIAYAADKAVGGIFSKIIKLGAIAGLSSVIMVLLLGQARIFWNMSKDGLLPKFVSNVHPRFKTPWLTSIVTGVLVAFFASTYTVKEAGNLCSIGTLLAFMIVCVSVLILRIREPHHHRAFRAPALWLIAPAGAISSLILMCSLQWPAWQRLIYWYLIGMVIYVTYSKSHSRLNHRPETRPPIPVPPPPYGT